MVLDILGVKIDKKFQRDLVRSLILGLAVSAGSAVGTFVYKSISKTASSALGIDINRMLNPQP